MEVQSVQVGPVSWRRELRAGLSIARFDHWTKNVFVLPGVIIPVTILRPPLDWRFWSTLAIGLFAVGLIASSNYTLNEVLDAPFDRVHPLKKQRPVAQGLIRPAVAYGQWILLMSVGLALAWAVSVPFLLTMTSLWVMGCVYNIPPLRAKDLPYVDVLAESVNNPLRMLAGWYIVTSALVPPLSLLVSYWMVGCYFMALKRFSEFRELGDRSVAGAYRRSFRYYTDRSLLVSVVFYSAASMLFFGAFVIRYRLELVLSFPLVALVMAVYFHLAFESNSAVQNPESLYRQWGLMIAVVTCVTAMCALFVYDIPSLYRIFAPTLPLPGSR